METRTFPDTDLAAGVVGLGCNNFGLFIDQAATQGVVDAAVEAGVNFFDTARFVSSQVHWNMLERDVENEVIPAAERNRLGCCRTSPGLGVVDRQTPAGRASAPPLPRRTCRVAWWRHRRIRSGLEAKSGALLGTGFPFTVLHALA